MNHSDCQTDPKLPYFRQSVGDNCRVLKRVLLTTDKICPSSVVESVFDPSCGAVATFFGVTRADSDKDPVLYLDYDSYEPMAVGIMNEIAEECISTWHTIKKLTIIHRLGSVSVGQISIGIAASSPHRSDALRAVQFILDAVKSRVPIWKKEVYASQSTPCWKRNAECFWTAKNIGSHPSAADF